MLQGALFSTSAKRRNAKKVDPWNGNLVCNENRKPVKDALNHRREMIPEKRVKLSNKTVTFISADY
jgi:hypothetical protein